MDLQTLLAKSSKRLNHPELHPKVKEAAEKLIELAYEKGIWVVIVQGVRTMKEQAAIYAQGRTAPGKIVSNAKPGYSPHNYGLAVDFALLKLDGCTVHWDVSADFNRDHQQDWFQVAAIAKQLDFEWGGDWQDFKDYPHLQMMFGLSIRDLRNGKRPLAYHPQPVQKSVDKSVDNKVINIQINGKPSAIKGLEKDDKSYLPVRALVKEIGSNKTVGWNGKVTIDGKVLESSVLISDTGYAWTKELANVFGLAVEWDAGTRTVKLTA